MEAAIAARRDRSGPSSAIALAVQAAGPMAAANVRRQSSTRTIAKRIARAAPWLVTLSSMPALTTLALTGGALVGLIASTDLYAPPLPRPGYPIHAERQAEPQSASGPEHRAALIDTTLPRATKLDTDKGMMLPAEQQAGFQWTMSTGLRDPAHCPAINPEFHQGCVDAIANLLSKV
jgi:hypothetical protein